MERGYWGRAWEDEEDDTLERLWPAATWGALERAFPDRSRGSLQARAKLLGVRRTYRAAPTTRKQLDCPMRPGERWAYAPLNTSVFFRPGVYRVVEAEAEARRVLLEHEKSGWRCWLSVDRTDEWRQVQQAWHKVEEGSE